MASNNETRKAELERVYDLLDKMICAAEDFQDGFVPEDLAELYEAKNGIARLMGRKGKKT